MLSRKRLPALVVLKFQPPTNSMTIPHTADKHGLTSLSVWKRLGGQTTVFLSPLTLENQQTRNSLCRG